tara:strand:- start:159 stop:335 length:177 start_codon:yes stop_codon:yes gene_type:complete
MDLNKKEILLIIKAFTERDSGMLDGFDPDIYQAFFMTEDEASLLDKLRARLKELESEG